MVSALTSPEIISRASKIARDCYVQLARAMFFSRIFGGRTPDGAQGELLPTTGEVGAELPNQPRSPRSLARAARAASPEPRSPLTSSAISPPRTAPLPSASLPSASLPSASLPHGHARAARAASPEPRSPLTSAAISPPRIAPLPSASLPSASLPSASLPGALLPIASLPSASLPSPSIAPAPSQPKEAPPGAAQPAPPSVDTRRLPGVIRDGLESYCLKNDCDIPDDFPMGPWLTLEAAVFALQAWALLQGFRLIKESRPTPPTSKAGSKCYLSCSYARAQPSAAKERKTVAMGDLGAKCCAGVRVEDSTVGWVRLLLLLYSYSKLKYY
jgi:hypothetical protein